MYVVGMYDHNKQCMHDTRYMTSLCQEAIWAHRTSLSPRLFIEVCSSSQEGGRSCISVLRVSILIFDFGFVPMVCYFCFTL